MQCPKCSYIRFKSSPKCQICGFNLKNRKSSNRAVWESEKIFSIFGSSGSEEESATPTLTATMEPPEPTETAEAADAEAMETETIDTGGFDPAMELLTDHIGDLEDFELDLSEMEDSDSEDWVVGATLVGDHSDFSNIANKNSAETLNEIEYQGLGFDTIGEDEERAVSEMEPYGRKKETDFEQMASEIKQIKEEIASDHPDQSENNQDSEIEFKDSSSDDDDSGLRLEVNDSSGESGEISLETELADDDKEISELALDSTDDPLELDPTHKMEELLLEMETESPDGASPKEDSVQLPDLESFFKDSGSDGKDGNNPTPEKKSQPDQ